MQIIFSKTFSYSRNQKRSVFPRGPDYPTFPIHGKRDLNLSPVILLSPGKNTLPLFPLLG